MASPAEPVSAAFAYSPDFAGALLDPGTPAPARITGPADKGAVKRFNVYRNNVAASLLDALAATFPATQRIVGEKFFRAMALMHVRSTPPTSPLLFEYGRDFPAFIDTFEHTRTMPWLGDVARIERAWLDAYHAADAAPMAGGALAAVAPQALGATRFHPHPATRIVRSSHPAVTIFSANRDGEPAGRITAEGAEDALITRPDLNVFVRWLPPGGATFTTRLTEGATLADAAAAAAEESAAFDLAANIEGVITAGAFAGISAPDAGH